jgi:hypothetical protein
MEQEQSCYFVSSRGIMKSCNFFSQTPVSSSPIVDVAKYNNFIGIKPNDTIYICNTAIPFFCKNILPNIPFPICVVSGDSDTTTPNDYPTTQLQNFYQDAKIIHWFSQNMQLSFSPKITQIPIGLDYHTMSQNKTSWGNQITSKEQEKQLCHILRHSKPFWERQCKIYANFQFLMTTRYAKERLDVICRFAEDAEDLIFFEPHKLERYDTWQNQTKFAFVISPQGNGMDCHRTWEALCLGCIPIVKTSALDPLFYDLPVLVVNNWQEITKDLLNHTVANFKNIVSTFKYEKLTLQYWKQKIKNTIQCSTILTYPFHQNPNYFILQQMKQKNIVLCGCVKNAEKYITSNIELFHRMGQQFGNYQIIILENNSNDNTRIILQQYKQHNNNIHLILEQPMQNKKRTEIIAHCRNQLLNYVKKYFAKFDYLIMMDMDDMLFEKQPDKTLYTCFANDDLHWNAQFANYIPNYYDIWAYREKGILETDCWLDCEIAKRQGLPQKWCEYHYVYKFSKFIHPQLPPIMVQSAFGGLGIYNLQHLIASGSQYQGLQNDIQICEHVPFHRGLFSNDDDTKLFINPKWIIS